MPDTVTKQEKLEYLKRAYNAAITYDQCIKQASVTQMDKVQNILIANTEGLLKRDRRVYTRMFISAVAEHNGEMQTGFTGPEVTEGLSL